MLWHVSWHEAHGNVQKLLDCPLYNVNNGCHSHGKWPCSGLQYTLCPGLCASADPPSDFQQSPLAWSLSGGDAFNGVLFVCSFLCSDATSKRSSLTWAHRQFLGKAPASTLALCLHEISLNTSRHALEWYVPAGCIFYGHYRAHQRQLCLHAVSSEDISELISLTFACRQLSLRTSVSSSASFLAASNLF